MELCAEIEAAGGRAIAVYADVNCADEVAEVFATAMPHPGALERGAKVVPAGRTGEPEESHER